MDTHLEYANHDIKNKDKDNSRNGHTKEKIVTLELRISPSFPQKTHAQHQDQEWQNRPLQTLYSIVFLDALC